MNDDSYVTPSEVVERERTSGAAVASLIFGLLSLVFCVFTGIPALILGILGLRDVERGGGRVKGRGIATTGLVLGGLTTVLTPVLGILIALLLPAVQAARAAAQRSHSRNCMKQIALALHNYHNVYGTFPPAYLADDEGRPMHSWRILITPYLDDESANLYEQYDFNEPWDGPHNVSLLEKMPDVFRGELLSSDQTTTNYVAVVGPETMFPGSDSVNNRDVTDGLSNTILFVEQTDSGIPWTEPRDLDMQTMSMTINDELGDGIRSNLSIGASVGMADGSVLFKRTDTSPNMLRALLTRAGGEVIPADSP